MDVEEKFGYVIKVDGKVVWEGRNPKTSAWSWMLDTNSDCTDTTTTTG